MAILKSDNIRFVPNDYDENSVVNFIPDSVVNMGKSMGRNVLEHVISSFSSRTMVDESTPILGQKPTNSLGIVLQSIGLSPDVMNAIRIGSTPQADITKAPSTIATEAVESIPIPAAAKVYETTGMSPEKAMLASVATNVIAPLIAFNIPSLTKGGISVVKEFPQRTLVKDIEAAVSRNRSRIIAIAEKNIGRKLTDIELADIEKMAVKAVGERITPEQGTELLKERTIPKVAGKAVKRMLSSEKGATELPNPEDLKKIKVNYVGFQSVPQGIEGYPGFHLVNEPSGTTKIYDPTKHEISGSEEGVEIPEELKTVQSQGQTPITAEEAVKQGMTAEEFLEKHQITDLADRGSIDGEPDAVIGDINNPSAIITTQMDDTEYGESIVIQRADGTYLLNPRTNAAGFETWDDAYAEYKAQLLSEYEAAKTKAEQPEMIEPGLEKEGSDVPPTLPPFPEELAGFEHVPSVESPELTKLARSLSGRTVGLKRFPKAKGVFYSNIGQIRLNPTLFRSPANVQRTLDKFNAKFIEGKKIPKALMKEVSDIRRMFPIKTDPDLGTLHVPEEYLAKETFGMVEKTLAHEIGHLIDWLPDKTMIRGNLLARAMSVVTKSMKQSFGELKEKELRAELKALTQFWKPFDEKAVPKHFLSYRYSAKELYADFMSVLLNNPAKAKELAPRFYDAFFKFLDKKPIVRSEFMKLQDLLLGQEEGLLKVREDDITGMFERSEDEFRKKRMQAEAAKRSIWWQLKRGLFDQDFALLEKRQQIYDSGRMNPEDDIEYLLGERSYVASMIKAELEDFDREVYQPLLEQGFSFSDDFGQMLFLQRIIGERGDLANPLGHNPESSRKQLEFMRKRLGDERYQQLEKFVMKTRNWFKKLNSLFEEDMLTSEQIAEISQNEVYAPFQSLKYLKEWISAGIIHQRGTLGDIANPGVSLVLKAISMIRAYHKNRITKTVAQQLIAGFPDEILEAPVTVRPGVFRIPEKNGYGIIKWKENGKWKAVYVDPYIADSFQHDTSDELQQLGTILGNVTLNNLVFRPVFITFNIGFQSFNLMRDFLRTWKSLPNSSLIDVVKQYWTALPPSLRRVAGQYDALIQQMEREGALGITYNQLIAGQTDEDTEIETILSRFDILQRKKSPPLFLRPLVKALDSIRWIGDVIETVPKVAGYIGLEHLDKAERAHFIRNYVGTPNFKRRGKWYALYNNLFLFSNMFKEGYRGDYELAFKNPKTRSGWWWKTAKVNIIPKVIMFLASVGLFGKGCKDNIDSASEYDKTNYTIIPVGETEKGKTVYLRIPQDETGRFIGGLVWKLLNLNKDKITTRDIQDILSLFGGQLPGLAPIVPVVTNLAEFAQGINPRDYRGRDILTEDEMKAGGIDAIKPMAIWTINQTGMTRLSLRDTMNDRTLVEKAVTTTPVINRWLKISDYGKVENLRDVMIDQQSTEAKDRLRRKKTIRSGIREGLSDSDILGSVSSNRSTPTLIRKQRLRVNESDPTTKVLLSATSNVQKANVLKTVQSQMSPDSFKTYVDSLVTKRVISPAVRQMVLPVVYEDEGSREEIRFIPN